MTSALTVRLAGPVQTEMTMAAVARAPNETGGLLLGWWEESNIIVRHAVEVPDHRATTTSWVRRPRVARRALKEALAEFNHPLLGYVGDWHIHPAVCRASGRDLQSIAETSTQYIDPIILLVLLPDGTIDARGAYHGRLGPVHLVIGVSE